MAGYDYRLERAAETAACQRCGSSLPDDAAYCPKCGLPQLRAARRPSEPERGVRPIAIVLIVLASVTSLVGGAVAAIVLTSPDEAAKVSATPLASDSPSGFPTEQSLGSVPPTPTTAPTATPVAVIPNRAMAQITVDALTLREQPAESATSLGEVLRGTSVFIIGAPREGANLRWYRVGVDEGAVTGGPQVVGCGEACPLAVGWVAGVSDQHEAWLEQIEVTCPESPMSIETLAALPRLARLHCYGQNDLVVTGTIETPCCNPPGPVAYTPHWLAWHTPPAYFHGTGIGFRAAPEAGLAVPGRGEVVRAVVHVEDDAAPSCRATVDPSFFAGLGSPPPVELPEVASLVLDCRTRLVVTYYDVIGTEDLGPCCGLDAAVPPA